MSTEEQQREERRRQDELHSLPMVDVEFDKGCRIVESDIEPIAIEDVEVNSGAWDDESTHAAERSRDEAQRIADEVTASGLGGHHASWAEEVALAGQRSVENALLSATSDRVDVLERIAAAGQEAFVGARSILDRMTESMARMPFQPVGDDNTAPGILQGAIDEMRRKAERRDAPRTGERAMARTVAIFNAMIDGSMSELEGWKFMLALKLARGGRGQFDRDDWVDLAAYAALAGERAAQP